MVLFQMEAELEQFHKKSTQLELTISELKLKLRATDKERQREMQRVCSALSFFTAILSLSGRDWVY